MGSTLPGNNCFRNYDCISGGSVAKNIILIGATEKITNNNGRYNGIQDVVKQIIAVLVLVMMELLSLILLGWEVILCTHPTSPQGSIEWETK